MLKKLFSILSIIYVLLLSSCSEKSDPKQDEQTFTKIYDNVHFSAVYFPIEIQQTDDGGYLVLGGRKLGDSESTGIYFLKSDKDGNFVSELEVPEQYVNPVGQFIKKDSRYYFFCMEGTSSRLASIDVDLTDFKANVVSKDLSYPAAGALDGDDFILLSYDYANRRSVVSVMSPSGNITKSASFKIEDEDQIEGPIINHFIRTGKQFPFQVGRIPGGLYYFNSFFNYSLSLVFTSLSDDDAFAGGVQGLRNYNGNISAVLPLGNSVFATSYNNADDNFLIPNATLSVSDNPSIATMPGKKNSFPELVPGAKVKIISAAADTKNILVYASDTRSKQIGLYFYDEATGDFFGSKYLGFSNPFEVACMIQTADGGLAVCGTTYLAGRFPRICLFKLSKDALIVSR